jgi:hypothetical protein
VTSNGKQEKLAAMAFEISELRNAEAGQAERIAPVDGRVQNNSKESRQAMTRQSDS